MKKFKEKFKDTIQIIPAIPYILALIVCQYIDNIEKRTRYFRNSIKRCFNRITNKKYEITYYISTDYSLDYLFTSDIKVSGIKLAIHDNKLNKVIEDGFKYFRKVIEIKEISTEGKTIRYKYDKIHTSGITNNKSTYIDFYLDNMKLGRMSIYEKF